MREQILSYFRIQKRIERNFKKLLRLVEAVGRNFFLAGSIESSRNDSVVR